MLRRTNIEEAVMSLQIISFAGFLSVQRALPAQGTETRTPISKQNSRKIITPLFKINICTYSKLPTKTSHNHIFGSTLHINKYSQHITIWKQKRNITTRTRNHINRIRVSRYLYSIFVLYPVPGRFSFDLANNLLNASFLWSKYPALILRQYILCRRRVVALCQRWVTSSSERRHCGTLIDLDELCMRLFGISPKRSPSARKDCGLTSIRQLPHSRETSQP